jgi:azurin
MAASGFAAEPVPGAKPTDSEAAAGTSAAATAPAKQAAGKKLLSVKIEMRDGLRFEPPRFEAQPGQEIEVSLENVDSTHQPHNFVVLQPGKREEVVQQALTLGEKGPAADYIPANPGILVHSALLNPEGANTVRFTLPAEKGIYPYVCTMPGHGMVMYGAIYAGVKMPLLAKDKAIPPQAAQNAIPGAGQRPYVQRIFLPNTGPASIAVALPGEQNYCWDAGECRLRYVWRGAFIDASANWRGNGRDLAVLPAEPWWTAAGDSCPLRFGTSRLTVKFLGYRLNGGLPEFHYRVGDKEVFETIAALPNNAGISERFRIPGAAQPVTFNAAPGSATLAGGAGSTRDGTIITPGQPADFSITFTESSTPAAVHPPTSAKP